MQNIWTWVVGIVLSAGAGIAIYSAFDGGGERRMSHQETPVAAQAAPVASVTAPKPAETFSEVRDALVESKLEAEDAEITMRPQTNVALDADDAQKMVRLLETLDDLDDVQQVYSNADISEDILATLE